jgi:hypothetical protein
MACRAGVEELLGGFGIEATDEFRRVFEIGKEHGDLLALALQGTTGGEDLLGEVRWGVRPRRTGGFPGRCGWHVTRPSVTRPDQDFPLFIHRQVFGVDQVFLERFQGVVIELQAEFEDAIREAFLLLKERQHLG